MTEAIMCLVALCEVLGKPRKRHFFRKSHLLSPHESAWRKVLASQDDSAFMLSMGINVRTFNWISQKLESNVKMKDSSKRSLLYNGKEAEACCVNLFDPGDKVKQNALYNGKEAEACCVNLFCCKCCVR